ncbi:MAG: hypothetical protein FVQ81_05100 [Candidatus Glassbacteria bacterium]|nr:hypothetical protein [Candidatus Glassbacteria bacterium]
MLSFLNPLALFGLIAAALPLVIHLLSRWRTRTLDFSSLLLLRKVQSRSVRRLRARQWLLLLLRTLIIILLVLVPARPAVRGLFGTGPEDHLPVEVVIITDNTASTRYVAGRGMIFNLLHAKIDRLVGWLGPADRYMLLEASFESHLDSRDWISPDPDKLKAEENLLPGFGSVALAPVIESAGRMFSADRDRYEREIYLFTDRQRGFLGADSLVIDTAAGIRLYLVDIHETGPRNTAVKSVGLPGELVRPGAPLEVTVGLTRFGGDSVMQVFPRIYLDGRLVGQGEATLEPDQEAFSVVEIPPLEPGYHELAAELDADPLAADNRRSIVLMVPEVPRVVLVERGLPAGPDFLGAALQVLSNSRAGAIRFRRAADLPGSPAEIGEADVFVVHGLDYPRSRIIAFLAELRRQGRHALFIPRDGDQSPREFNEAVRRLELPLELGGLARLGQGGFDLPQPERQPGKGEVFDRLFAGIGGLSQARLFSMRDLEQPEAGGAAWDLATRGARIWLRMVRAGDANLIVSTVDLGSDEETELPDTPLFVPLVHSLVTMLGDTGPLMRRSVTVGDEVTIYFGGTVNTAGMEIHGPGGARYLLPPGERDRWVFERTGEPGAYWLYRDGRLAGGFGAGLDVRESDVRLELDSRLERIFAGLNFNHVAAGSALEDGVLLGRGGVEIWQWLLIAALVLLGIEQLVANRRRDEE